MTESGRGQQGEEKAERWQDDTGKTQLARWEGTAELKKGKRVGHGQRGWTDALASRVRLWPE